MPDYLNDAARILDRATTDLLAISPECESADCKCCWCQVWHALNDRRNDFLAEIAERDAIQERPLHRLRGKETT